MFVALWTIITSIVEFVFAYGIFQCDNRLFTAGAFSKKYHCLQTPKGASILKHGLHAILAICAKISIC